MKPLTKKQKQVYDAYAEFYAKHGRPAEAKEVANLIGATPAAVRGRVGQIREAGCDVKTAPRGRPKSPDGHRARRVRRVRRPRKKRRDAGMPRGPRRVNGRLFTVSDATLRVFSGLAAAGGSRTPDKDARELCDKALRAVVSAMASRLAKA